MAAVPGAERKRFANLLTRGELEVEYYAPHGSDPQQPHKRDELYFIAAGTGEFVCNDARVPFSPGDVLFVPARAVHRFENFSSDFGTWVVFYGPDGGDLPRRVQADDAASDDLD